MSSDWIARAAPDPAALIGGGGPMPAGTAGPTSQEPGGLLGFSVGSAAIEANFENYGTASGGTVITGTPVANQQGLQRGSESDDTFGKTMGTRPGNRGPEGPGTDDDNTYGLTWGTRKGNR